MRRSPLRNRCESERLRAVHTIQIAVRLVGRNKELIMNKQVNKLFGFCVRIAFMGSIRASDVVYLGTLLAPNWVDALADKMADR